MAHNRYWAVDNVYAKQNGGGYDFVVERQGEGAHYRDYAWPTEQRFWDDLMYNSTKCAHERTRLQSLSACNFLPLVAAVVSVVVASQTPRGCIAGGMFMYEQDWLDDEYDRVVHLNTNATAGRTWLMQMGAAASRRASPKALDPGTASAARVFFCRPARSCSVLLGPATLLTPSTIAPHAATDGATIQYCMSHVRHILQSVELPAVTNARASGDYHPGNEQWQPLGTTGSLAWALAIAPSKDNYWSTDVQRDSAYKDYKTIKEPYNRLQAAVSTLSKGPVAPSDKLGRSDVALILKSCAADGTLLQGDKPAMAIDAQHVRKAFGCADDGEKRATGGVAASSCDGPGGEVWATYTHISSASSSSAAGFESAHAVVLAANLTSPYTLKPSDLEQSLYVPTLSGAPCVVAYEANTTSSLVMPFAQEGGGLTLRAANKWDFEVWALAPCGGSATEHAPTSPWVLLGEPNKWVPVSSARFSRLDYSFTRGGGAKRPKHGSSSMTWRGAVTAKGSVGEVLHVAWAWLGDPVDRKASPTRRLVQCHVPSSGSVRITVVSTVGATGADTATFDAYCDSQRAALE